MGQLHDLERISSNGSQNYSTIPKTTEEEMTHSTKNGKRKLFPDQARKDKLDARMAVCTRRLENFSGWYLLNPNMGVDCMLREIFIQNAINHAFIMAIGRAVKRDGRNFSQLDVLEDAIRVVEDRLADHEKQHGITITMRQCGKDIDPNLEKPPEPAPAPAPEGAVTQDPPTDAVN